MLAAPFFVCFFFCFFCLFFWRKVTRTHQGIDKVAFPSLCAWEENLVQEMYTQFLKLDSMTQNQ